MPFKGSTFWVLFGGLRRGVPQMPPMALAPAAGLPISAGVVLGGWGVQFGSLGLRV